MTQVVHFAYHDTTAAGDWGHALQIEQEGVPDLGHFDRRAVQADSGDGTSE